jgi:hypothetical protein
LFLDWGSDAALRLQEIGSEKHSNNNKLVPVVGANSNGFYG